MKRKLSILSLLVCLCLGLSWSLQAQTTINTTVGSTGYTGSNGAGAGFAVTFVIENTSGAGILLTDVKQWFPSGYSGGVDLWYSSTSLSGSYGTLATPTWNLVGSGTMNSTVAGITNINWSPGLNFLIPNNTTYRFALYCAAYCSYSGTGVGTCTPNTFTSGGVSLYTGDYQIAAQYVGFGGSNNPRFFTGSVTFMPALPCVAPPTPGTATATPSNVCSGNNFLLGLTGNSIGTGQTYQWQSATSTAGPWTNVGSSQNTSSLTTTATSTMYYRCAVTCGTSTVYSTPVQVTVPALFPGGTYTINSAVPTGGTNFQTFSAAASAISCGISASVIFNVAPGSGPYNEQVSIPAINTNATRTVTFNCNNVNLTYTNTNAANYALFRLDGTDYVRIKRLNVIPNPTGSYGFGFLLTNDADNNLIDSCKVDNGLTTTSTSFSGIVVGGSATSPTASPTGSCDSNIISNNEIIGGYYATTSVGVSNQSNLYNQFLNNVIHDYYVYGHYMLYNTNHQLVGNDFHRMNRTSVSTFYGCYMSTGNLKSNISKNRIHNPFTAATPTTNTSSAYGVYHGSTATAGNENVVSNNIFYNMDGNGAHYVMYSAGPYVRWYFNTVSEDYQGSTAGLTYVCYVISSYAGVEYRNNVISLTRAGSTSRYCVYHSSTAYPAIHNNNDYYVTGASNNVGYYGGTTAATLAAWQTASSKDANSYALNPQFTNAATGDLTPNNNAMDNIGVPIAGITTDITGTIRNAVNPDAGAFEFNNFCAPPTGLAATNVTNNSASLTWNTVTGLGYEYVISQSPTPPASGTLVTSNSYAASGLNGSTTYYFHVRNKCGSTNFSTWVTTSFTTCPNAVITPQSSIIFCAGGSVNLVASPGTGYQWLLNGTNIPGATASSYTATAAGNYAVTITSAGGCAITSLPVPVQVGTPPATITPSGSVNACPGVGITLSALSGVGLTYQWKLNGNNITGATNATYNATAAGNYTVFISSGPNCNATTASPTVVTMYPVTPASIVTPQYTAVCPGNALTLNANTGNNLTYQWQLNGTNISGATSPFLTLSTPGAYSVKVTSTVTGCTNSSAAINIVSSVAPTASISAPGQVTACDSALLTANSGTGYTYQWVVNGVDIPGATGQTYGAPTSGIYTVRVINSGGCYTTSSAVTVTVNPSPAGVITYNSPLVFCEGSAVVLNVTPEPGLLLQWMQNGNPIPGGSGLQYMANTSGTYAVLSTNSYGCSRMSQPVQVTVHAMPQPAVTRNGNNLTTGNYALYQWNFNRMPIPGATGQVFNPTTNGAYSVAVTDANGCTGESAIFFLNTLGISNPVADAGLKIYPNPAQTFVTVEQTGKARMTGISVISSIGAVVYQQADVKTDKVTIQTGALAAGIYTVRVQTEQGTVLRKLDIRK